MITTINLANYDEFLDRFKSIRKTSNTSFEIVTRSLPLYESSLISKTELNDKAIEYIMEQCPYPIDNYEIYKFPIDAKVLPYNEIEFNLAKSMRINSLKVNNVETSFGYKTGKLVINKAMSINDTCIIEVTEGLRSRDTKLGMSRNYHTSYVSTGLYKMTTAYPLTAYINDMLFIEYYTSIGDLENAEIFQNMIDRIILEAQDYGEPSFS